MNKLLYLLSALVSFLERLGRKREQREAQNERDDLESNPADWYNQHFDGVRRDDAGKAHEAKPDSDRKG